MMNIQCPICSSDPKYVEVKNIGFVNARWEIRGQLRKNEAARIKTDGMTYDGKLYTFEEMDHKTAWKIL